MGARLVSACNDGDTCPFTPEITAYLGLSSATKLFFVLVHLPDPTVTGFSQIHNISPDSFVHIFQDVPRILQSKMQETAKAGDYSSISIPLRNFPSNLG